MAATPQDAAASEASDLTALPSAALAKAWSRVSRDPVASAPYLEEVNRRYWLEQHERAEAGGPLRLFPAWRALGTQAEVLETCGVRPFA